MENTKSVDLESVLDWSEPERKKTKRGVRILRKADPNEDFWQLWNANKSKLKDMGISPSKWKGKWEVCWWQEPEDKKESVEKSKASDSDIEVPSPDELEYRPFQKAAIEYIQNQDGALISDEMGCVSGDSIVQINRGGKGMKISLEKAYRRMHGLARENWNWDPDVSFRMKALVDGELRQHDVKDIIDKGKKKLWSCEQNLGKLSNLLQIMK